MTDLSLVYDFTHSISSACGRIPEFGVICSTMKVLTEKCGQIPLSQLDLKQLILTILKYIPLPVIFYRADEQYTEYQQEGISSHKDGSNDRVFPLETVELQSFNAEHDHDIGNAIIHIGPYANDFARSLNALALTVGDDIYFRNNAYNTGTEEGKKTIAHELTHIAQYKENRIKGNENKDLIEAEAKEAEGRVTYTDDPYLTFKYRQGQFSVRNSKLKQFSEELAESIEAEVHKQKNMLNDKKYFQLLLVYKTWLKEGTGDGLYGV